MRIRYQRISGGDMHVYEYLLTGAWSQNVCMPHYTSPRILFENNNNTNERAKSGKIENGYEFIHDNDLTWQRDKQMSLSYYFVVQ